MYTDWKISHFDNSFICSLINFDLTALTKFASLLLNLENSYVNNLTFAFQYVGMIIFYHHLLTMMQHILVAHSNH